MTDQKAKKLRKRSHLQAMNNLTEAAFVVIIVCGIIGFFFCLISIVLIAYIFILAFALVISVVLWPFFIIFLAYEAIAKRIRKQ